MASWDHSFEDDLSLRRPIEEQIIKSLTFLQEHETFLNEMNKIFSSSSFTSFSSSSSLISLSTSFISIVTQPNERVFSQDLILTDNSLLHKVLTVLIFLCDEINELNEISRKKLFLPLIMFGQQPVGLISEEEQEKNDGKKEKMIGFILPLLQEISNFIDRCYSVTINVIQQLSSLISGKEQLYRSSFQNVHLEKVFLFYFFTLYNSFFFLFTHSLSSHSLHSSIGFCYFR